MGASVLGRPGSPRRALVVLCSLFSGGVGVESAGANWGGRCVGGWLDGVSCWRRVFRFDTRHATCDHWGWPARSTALGNRTRPTCSRQRPMTCSPMTTWSISSGSRNRHPRTGTHPRHPSPRCPGPTCPVRSRADRHCPGLPLPPGWPPLGLRSPSSG